MPDIRIRLEIDDAIIFPSRLRTSSSNASEVSELAVQVSILLRYTSDSLSVTSELCQNVSPLVTSNFSLVSDHGALLTTDWILWLVLPSLVVSIRLGYSFKQLDIA